MDYKFIILYLKNITLFFTFSDSDGWPLDMHNRRILAMAAAQQLQESDHDDYRETGANGAAFIRSIALIVRTLDYLNLILYFLISC